MSTVYGGIEAGGTKFICAVGKSPKNLYDITKISTTTPEETLPAVIAYFERQREKYDIASIGIASFGPVDLCTHSPTYGYLTNTPKKVWQHTDFVGTIKNALQIPTTIDTDTNGAALAEGAWGIAQGLDTYIYITIGTGIGVGIIINNQPLHGMLHPEGGHILLPIHPQDTFTGTCPFHGHCFEGLASAPSIRKRWGVDAADLPDEHIAWDIEAHYIALGTASYIYTISPQRIIIGGGVMQRSVLIEKVRTKIQKLLNGYIDTKEINEQISSYIVTPKLMYCGVLGAILLAQKM